MPPLQPRTCCWEKTRKDGVKSPTHSFRKLWGFLKYAVGLRGKQYLMQHRPSGQGYLHAPAVCTNTVSVRVLLQDQELWLSWEQVMTHPVSAQNWEEREMGKHEEQNNGICFYSSQPVFMRGLHQYCLWKQTGKDLYTHCKNIPVHNL